MWVESHLGVCSLNIYAPGIAFGLVVPFTCESSFLSYSSQLLHLLFFFPAFLLLLLFGKVSPGLLFVVLCPPHLLLLLEALPLIPHIAVC